MEPIPPKPWPSLEEVCVIVHDLVQQKGTEEEKCAVELLIYHAYGSIVLETLQDFDDSPTQDFKPAIDLVDQKLDLMMKDDPE